MPCALSACEHMEHLRGSVEDRLDCVGERHARGARGGRAAARRDCSETADDSAARFGDSDTGFELRRERLGSAECTDLRVEDDAKVALSQLWELLYSCISCPTVLLPERGIACGDGPSHCLCG